MTDNQTGKKIKAGEKVSFAVGEIYGSGGVAILSLLYLKFLTDIVGIKAAVAGSILMIARIWDAISDPLMGTISDNTRTKWGRRRPYIFASGFLVIIALFVLFMPWHGGMNDAGKVAYFVFAHIFYSTMSTIFNVPYLSLTSEISQDTKERSTMNFARIACGMVATAIIYIMGTELFSLHSSGKLSNTAFSLVVAGVFSIFFAVPILCSAIFTKERTPLPNNKVKFSFKIFTNTFKLKCFRRLLLMYVFAFSCNEILASLIITYVYNVAGGASIKVLGMALPTIVNISMLGGAGIIMPVALIMLNKKVPKPVIFMCGVPMFLGGAIGLATFPSSADPRLMIIPALIAGLGFGMAQIIPWLTFPDVVDVAELKSNDRNPGAYNGTMTFFKKFASGMSVFLVGLVLQATGYEEGKGTSELQPASAVKGMRLILGICITVFLIIAFYGAFKIKITTKKSERVTYFISKQREGELDNLDESEKAELETLKKELF